MKKQSSNPFSISNKAQTEHTATVKETVVPGSNQSRTFSSADIWDIQRRGRTMFQRRSCF